MVVAVIAFVMTIASGRSSELGTKRNSRPRPTQEARRNGFILSKDLTGTLEVSCYFILKA